MKKTLTRRGRHTILPIVGDTVCSICLSAHRAPEIIFADADSQESLIELEDCFFIGRGGSLASVTPRSDSPSSLAPLLECIGSTVTEATAHADGRLSLSFSNAIQLEISSTTGYEAWHFQFPRPGRPPVGDVSNHLSLHGGYGHLV